MPLIYTSRTGLTRRAFMYLTSLVALAAGRISGAAAMEEKPPAAGLTEWNELLTEANDFPLMSALFGRRSRRFGWGMEIPEGPLAYQSKLPPTALDDFERAFVIAAGLGVSGWHNGIPYSATQAGLCSYSVRYTGRTFPVAAGIGNTDMFYTQAHRLETGFYDKFFQPESYLTSHQRNVERWMKKIGANA